MKFQLVILSAFLLSTLALPVPDEEVSVVQPAVAPDAKTGDGKLVELKSEGRASEKLAALNEEKKQTENTASALATKSSDLNKKEEKLTEAIIPAAPELDAKSINSPILADKPLAGFVDEKKEEPKSLPLAPAPESIVPELKSIEGEKLNAAEIAKPVQIIEAKSAILGEAEKKTEAKLTDEAPAASETLSIASAGQSVSAAAVDSALAAAAPEKKDDAAGRQIRGTDDKVEAPKSVVAGDVKSLSIETSEAAAAGSESGAAPAALEKSAELKEEKAEVKSAAPELEKTTAEKKSVSEEKKSDSSSSLEIAPEPKSAAAAESPAVLPEAKKIEESAVPAAASAVAQPEEAKKQEIPKKLENLKKQEIAKKESPESKESDESKESVESKEDKSA